MVVAVAALVVVSGVLLSGATQSTKSAPPKVTVTALGYEWDTPPSVCPLFGLDYPGVPFTVGPDSQFTVSFYDSCEGTATNGTYYVIDSVSTTSEIPFTIVSSNVPVDIHYGSYSWFNVTLAAPDYQWSGQLFLTVIFSEE